MSDVDIDSISSAVYRGVGMGIIAGTAMKVTDMMGRYPQKKQQVKLAHFKGVKMSSSKGVKIPKVEKFNYKKFML